MNISTNSSVIICENALGSSPLWVNATSIFSYFFFIFLLQVLRELKNSYTGRVYVDTGIMDSDKNKHLILKDNQVICTDGEKLNLESSNDFFSTNHKLDHRFNWTILLTNLYKQIYLTSPYYTLCMLILHIIHITYIIITVKNEFVPLERIDDKGIGWYQWNIVYARIMNSGFSTFISASGVMLFYHMIIYDSVYKVSFFKQNGFEFAQIDDVTNKFTIFLNVGICLLIVPFFTHIIYMSIMYIFIFVICAFLVIFLATVSNRINKEPDQLILDYSTFNQFKVWFYEHEFLCNTIFIRPLMIFIIIYYLQTMTNYGSLTLLFNHLSYIEIMTTEFNLRSTDCYVLSVKEQIRYVINLFSLLI
jgi:hypothetical protein